MAKRAVCEYVNVNVKLNSIAFSYLEIKSGVCVYVGPDESWKNSHKLDQYVVQCTIPVAGGSEGRCSEWVQDIRTTAANVFGPFSSFYKRN